MNFIRIALCSLLLGGITKTTMAMTSPSIKQEAMLRSIQTARHTLEQKRLADAHAKYHRLLKDNPKWKPTYADMPEFHDARMASATVLARQTRREKEASEKVLARGLKQQQERTKKYSKETASASSVEFNEEE